MAKSGPSTRSGTAVGDLVEPSPRPHFHQLMKWVCPSTKPGRFWNPSRFLCYALHPLSFSIALACAQKPCAGCKVSGKFFYTLE